MQNTLIQYDFIIEKCRNLFHNKLQDYGVAWRILRLTSLTDQIYIKASRIRTLQEKKVAKVAESEESEFIGIINYSIISLIQKELGIVESPDITIDDALIRFDKKAKESKDLMTKKNHDYGEAWREMRVSSITDLILQKILRIKQIEDNEGKTLVSEGLEANYYDMINYSVFALILLDELKK